MRQVLDLSAFSFAFHGVDAAVLNNSQHDKADIYGTFQIIHVSEVYE